MRWLMALMLPRRPQTAFAVRLAAAIPILQDIGDGTNPSSHTVAIIFFHSMMTQLSHRLIVPLICPSMVNW